MPTYFDGTHHVEYFDKRECLAENFNPMLTNNPELWRTVQKYYVQVLINFLGRKIWVNIFPHWWEEEK